MRIKQKWDLACRAFKDATWDAVDRSPPYPMSSSRLDDDEPPVDTTPVHSTGYSTMYALPRPVSIFELMAGPRANISSNTQGEEEHEGPPESIELQQQKTAFNAYWRNVFTHLLTEIERNDEIPLYLTEPPVSRVSIKLWNKPDPRCSCPCLLPDVMPTFFITAPEDAGAGGFVGVTKMDLIAQLRDYLYPEDEPLSSRPAGPGVGSSRRSRGEPLRYNCNKTISLHQGVEEPVGGPLVYMFSWMHYGHDDADPEILVYCYDWKSHEERKAQKAREKMVREEYEKRRQEEEDEGNEV